MSIKRIEPARSHVNERALRIFFLIDDLSCGGAQRLLLLLASGLVSRGHAVHVCALQTDATLAAMLRNKGAEVVVLNRERPSLLTSPWEFVRYAVQSYGDVRNRICAFNPDVVHVHLSDAEFIGIAAGWLEKVRCMAITSHGPAMLPKRPAWDPRNWLRILATRWLIGRTHGVVAVSQETKDELVRVFGVDGRRVSVVENGIDILPFKEQVVDMGSVRRNLLGQSASACSCLPIVCSVGRLVELKNHAGLIQAVARLRDRGIVVDLVLVGDGECREALTSLARDMGLDDYVHFSGYRDDVPSVLAVCNVFVLPSLFEGSSLALLEAMAAALPIVATDIPGNAGILRDGFSGRMVKPDDIDAMADAIAWLLENPEPAREMAQNAHRALLERFTLEKMLDRYEVIWRRTL